MTAHRTDCGLCMQANAEVYAASWKEAQSSEAEEVASGGGSVGEYTKVLGC
jgi:hypothetical protein